MRLFVGLDIEAEIRLRIAAFRDQMRELAPDVRWVSPETFHVTLQFLGETTAIEAIKSALVSVKSAPVQLTFRSAGFFPNAQSPRVFWVGIESDEHLQQLADAVASSLQALGFERDAGPYRPHLTLARAGSGRPRPVSGEHATPSLQRVRANLENRPIPEFGTMTARQYYVFESKLSPAGAKYLKAAQFPLE